MSHDTDAANDEYAFFHQALALGPRVKAPDRYLFTTKILRQAVLTRFVDREDGVDSAVRAYLVLVLSEYAQPRAARDAYLCATESGLFERIQAHEARTGKDHGFRARIYRANADDRLIQGALFRHQVGVDSLDRQLARARAYYDHACGNQRMAEAWARKPHSLSFVLSRLVEGFEGYAGLLTGIRSDFPSLLATN